MTDYRRFVVAMALVWVFAICVVYIPFFQVAAIIIGLVAYVAAVWGLAILTIEQIKKLSEQD